MQNVGALLAFLILLIILLIADQSRTPIYDYPELTMAPYTVPAKINVPTDTPTPKPPLAVLPTRTPTPDLIMTELAISAQYGDITVLTPNFKEVK